jgi:hypothetical protein
VRYQARDVHRAVTFYTDQLGCELKHQQGAGLGGVVRRTQTDDNPVELFEPARRS